MAARTTASGRARPDSTNTSSSRLPTPRSSGSSASRTRTGLDRGEDALGRPLPEPRAELPELIGPDRGLRERAPERPSARERRQDRELRGGESRPPTAPVMAVDEHPRALPRRDARRLPVEHVLQVAVDRELEGE